MAIESFYLRKKIKYHLTTLEKYTEVTEIPDDKDYRVDEYFSAVEINIIEICSLMRKMDDLRKLPDGTLSGRSLKATLYPSHGPGSQRAFVDIGKEYDFDSPSQVSVTLRDVCNMVIHSYVLQASGDEKRIFSEIMLVSDYGRFTGLYAFSIRAMVKKFRDVVDLYPGVASADYNEAQQKWVYKMGQSKQNTK